LGNEEGDPWAMKKKVLEQLGWGGEEEEEENFFSLHLSCF
jgi:hypothetical protein